MEIADHDPHYQAEADLQEKGLSQDAVGLAGGTILAISCVAPAYTLTATIGLLVSESFFKGQTLKTDTPALIVD